MSIAIQESVKNLITSGNSFLLPSWTPQANELVLVMVAMRGQSIVPSLSGNGLTFVEITRKDDVQGVGRVIVFRAMGASPSSGQITVTVTGNTKPVAAIAMRVSGTDTSGTNGSGAIEATATAEVGSVDNDDLKVDITTLTNGARAIAVSYARLADITLPSGEVAIDINYSAGSGGDNVRASAWYEDTPTAGTITLGADNDLSSAREWAVIAIGVKPASAGGYEEELSLTITSATSVSDLQGYREALAVTAQHADSLADRQHYREALAITQTATVLVQEVQKYIEQLNVVLAQQAALVDLQGYRESLLLSAGAQVAIGDLQHYREALALAAQVVATVLDELGSTIAELLSVTGLATVSIREEQHYREALAATALAQISGADVQAYRESLSIIITQLATLRDVLHGLITGIRYRFTHSVQTEFKHERHTAFEKAGPETQFRHTRKTDFIHRGNYEFTKN